jgi:hypothetical protein
MSTKNSKVEVQDYSEAKDDYEESNRETDTEEDSWFSNFQFALDLHAEPIKINNESQTIGLESKKPSVRWNKLTRSCAGRQTHLDKTRVEPEYKGKSALTLYLEEKNALYESCAVIALARMMPPPPEPVDPSIKEHWKEIELMKAAIRLRWASSQTSTTRKTYNSKVNRRIDTAQLRNKIIMKLSQAQKPYGKFQNPSLRAVLRECLNFDV